VKLLKDLSITVVLGAIFIALLNGGLWIAGLNYEGSLYRPDRELGHVLRPGAEGWAINEQENYVRINTQGLRDREHTLQRPANVIRIAVVGDSFSEAREVDQDATYWSVMERELNRRLQNGGLRIEVINFGVDGYGLAQEYMTIKKRIWQYDPQIIILSGNLHSLVLRSSRRFETNSAKGPYYAHRNGELVLDDISEREQRAFVSPSHMSETFENLINECRVCSLFNAARRKVSSEAGALAHRINAPAGAASEVPGENHEDAVLRGPVSPDLTEAWTVGEELIRLSHAEAARHHVEFWFFVLDMAPQVDPDAEKRTRTMRDLGINDLFLADKSFADFATHAGIMHGILAPKMLAYAEENHVVLHGFTHRPRNTGHWNEIGHQVVGRLIAQELLDCSAVIRGIDAPLAGAPQRTCNDNVYP
jgi:hypothetical protein